MRFTTYNIRYDTPQDGEWRWRQRQPFVLDNLERLNPDVFAVVEALPQQFVDLNELPGYAHCGVPRDDGIACGEATVIYYDAAQFARLDAGHRWVSNTPLQPSQADGTGNKRVFQWVHLRRLTDEQPLLVVACHLDDWSEAARKLGMRQIAEFLQPAITAHEPVIWCGDFNMEATDAAYAQLPDYLHDAALIAKHRVDPFNGTWPDQADFSPVTTQNVQRLDYFFVSELVQVDQYLVDTTLTSVGRYASDHFPLTIDVTLKKGNSHDE